MKIESFILALAAGLLISTSAMSQGVNEPYPELTDVCALSAHPKDYQGKVVQVRARLISGMHGSGLFDDGCAGKDVHFWMAKGAKENSDFKALNDALTRQGNSGTSDKRIDGTFTGRLLRNQKVEGRRYKGMVLEADHVDDLDVENDSIIGDFTRSPNEHIINVIKEPFVVKSVEGLITLPNGDGPIEGVLFEIQGPDADRTIRRCTTDQHGRFKMGRISQGTYRFKTTLEGYQSEIGSIMISKKSSKTNEIKIEVPVGV